MRCPHCLEHWNTSPQPMALLAGIGGCDLIGESMSLEMSFEGLKTQAISSLLSLFPTYSSISEP